MENGYHRCPVVLCGVMVHPDKLQPNPSIPAHFENDGIEILEKCCRRGHRLSGSTLIYPKELPRQPQALLHISHHSSACVPGICLKMLQQQ